MATGVFKQLDRLNKRNLPKTGFELATFGSRAKELTALLESILIKMRNVEIENTNQKR